MNRTSYHCVSNPPPLKKITTCAFALCHTDFLLNYAMWVSNWMVAAQAAFESAVLHLMLAPYDSEQADLVARVSTVCPRTLSKSMIVRQFE